MHLEHDLRYEMADEFVELATQLCDHPGMPMRSSADEKGGTFVDPTKVRAIDFKGGSSRPQRGPLNTAQPPQGATGAGSGRWFTAGSCLRRSSMDIVIAALGTVAE